MPGPKPPRPPKPGAWCVARAAEAGAALAAVAAVLGGVVFVVRVVSHGAHDDSFLGSCSKWARVANCSVVSRWVNDRSVTIVLSTPICTGLLVGGGGQDGTDHDGRPRALLPRHRRVVPRRVRAPTAAQVTTASRSGRGRRRGPGSREPKSLRSRSRLSIDSQRSPRNAPPPRAPRARGPWPWFHGLNCPTIAAPTMTDASIPATVPSTVLFGETFGAIGVRPNCDPTKNPSTS